MSLLVVQGEVVHFLAGRQEHLRVVRQEVVQGCGAAFLGAEAEE
jgi:predicted double-glycine peptidase